MDCVHFGKLSNKKRGVYSFSGGWPKDIQTLVLQSHQCTRVTSCLLTQPRSADGNAQATEEVEPWSWTSCGEQIRSQTARIYTHLFLHGADFGPLDTYRRGFVFLLRLRLARGPPQGKHAILNALCSLRARLQLARRPSERLPAIGSTEGRLPGARGGRAIRQKMRGWAGV